ncbi:MAG: hypothetical protein K6W08_15320, partial [Firmicutes bacterium]|nr:hypothetical protein [Bacillota bacterium]
IHQRVWFSDAAFLVALKLPAVAADLLTGWVIFAWARRVVGRDAVLLASAYLLNPGVVFVSAYWGQVDAVGALLAVAGLAALRPEAPVAGAVLLTAAVLVKPQVAPALLPAGVYLAHALLRPRQGGRRWDLLLDAAAAALATGVALLAPFGLGPRRLRETLQSSLGVYPYGSVMAFNAWGAAAGFWTSDSQRWLGMPYYAIGAAATLVVLALIAVWVWRHPGGRTAVMAAGVALLATFVLPTRIHERYLLYTVPCFAMAAALDRRVAGLYAALSLLLNANLLYAYTRPHLQTFVLPPWLEATVFSGGAVRLWSAFGALALPAALYLLFTWRGSDARLPTPGIAVSPPAGTA